jgi:mono/diheme cytochrome c family protein
MKLGIASILFAASCVWAQLPDGPGQELATRVCSECHSLDLISAMRMDAPGWKAEVDKMIARGATASPEEAESIVTYLAKSFPQAGGPQAGAAPVAAKGGPAPRELPDGPGKPIILRECVGCHQPTAFSTYQHTPEEWTAIVTRMGARAKSATQPELETVAKYLAASFPKIEDSSKVNVNKAAAKDIAERLGLTTQEAELIVEFRTKHGNFREWGDLLIIYGLNGRKVQAVKDRMSF